MIIALLILILLAILFPGLLRAAFVCVALVVLLAIGSAHRAGAEEVPITDVEAACNWRFQGNRYAFNRCVDIEQTTYNLLKGLWPNLPRNIRDQATAMTQRLVVERNPYVYQNTYDLVLMLLDQQRIKEENAAPKRQFQP